MKTKKFGYLFASAVLALTLAACGNDEQSADQLNDGVIKVGVTAGLHEEITEVAAKIAEENGLEVQIEVFSDYVLPNTALVEGDLDVNNFQHGPFLDNFNADRGEDLVAVADTILNPMGFYSESYTSIDDVPESSKMAIPNDPTNGGRALAVLAEAGYITLTDGVGINGTIYDIVENRKNFEFIELEAAQIPTQLGEVAVAAINTNFAMEAGLSPKEDSILLESADSPYINVIVVRPGDEDGEDLKKFIEAYQSDEVRQYIEKTYDGAVIPGF
ncbi:MetQ/NlpA family ABC transporter substrate-binding protein [Lysinibacillus sp. LZ02]|uniref:MetQ/NlpA family ABC transporter substrate-binding protein n=1 Tax=Lysinibacillus sp. LZ02 TaxID=3420668 RepID=UPI003D36F373